MPTDSHRFPTDGPVRLHVRSSRGSVQVVAADVAETVVEITSRHDGHQARVSASSDGRTVTVDVPRHRRLGNAPRLDITVSLPQGSTLDLGTASASVATRGPVAKVEVRTASGSISVEQVAGDLDARTASGDVHAGAVGGAATLKSASGDLHIATVEGRCIAASASGSIDIGWAGELVTAVTASGDVTVRDAARGQLTLKTTSGDVTVGVRKGTLVWLDLTTVSGRTTSALTPDDAPPGRREEALTINARTVSGDITISPSAAAAAA